MIAFIYRITNTVNNKKYIGVTTDPDRRKGEHLSGTTKGSKLVQRAIKKYGKDFFNFDILVEGDETKLYNLEPAYIIQENSLSPYGYNIAEGGKGGKTGPLTEETRKKMSVAHTGKKKMPHTKETKEKISTAAIGRKASNETKAKMSNSHNGEKNAMFGRTHSEETKDKIRLTKIGKEGPKKGIPRTDEVKKKISDTKRLNKLAKMEVTI